MKINVRHKDTKQYKGGRLAVKDIIFKNNPMNAKINFTMD